MKIFLHLIRNDIRFLKSWLWGWAGVLMVPVILFLFLHTDLGWQPAYWSFLGLVLLFVYLVQMIVQVILISKLIQKESPVYRQAYWVTRPIRPLHLLAAKFLGIVGVVFLPLLVQSVVLLLMLGRGASSIFEVLRLVSFLYSLFTLLIAMAAVFTRDTGKAILVCMLLPIPFVLFRSLILWLSGDWFFQCASLILPFFQSAVKVLLVASVFLAAGWGFWRCYQQGISIWRKLFAFWPLLLPLFLFDQYTSPLKTPEQMLVLPKEAAITLKEFRYEVRTTSSSGRYRSSSGASVGHWQSAERGSELGVEGKLVWSGVPDDSLWKSYALATVSPDGKLFAQMKRKRAWQSGFVFNDPVFKKSLFPEVSNETQRAATPFWKKGTPLFACPKSEMDLFSFPASFTSTVVSDFYTPKVQEIPLSTDRALEIPGGRLFVESVELRGDDLLLQLKYLNLHKFPISSDLFMGGFYAARDPATENVVFARRGGAGGTHFLNIISTGHIELTFDGMGMHVHDLSGLEFSYIQPVYMGSDIREVTYSLGENSF